MSHANNRHKMAGKTGRQTHPMVLTASAMPIMTGTAAAERVLGRVASSHARRLLTRMISFVGCIAVNIHYLVFSPTLGLSPGLPSDRKAIS